MSKTFAFTGAFMLLCAFSTGLEAQKIKFKLTYEDGVYKGTMSPRWYNEVQIDPPGEDQRIWKGASGVMAGVRFGVQNFTIETNELGTGDELMIKTANGWYPISSLEFSRDKARVTYDMSFRARATSVDLAAMERANELLAQEFNWQDQDDRLCKQDTEDEKWSLYCALKQGYLDVTGDFNHRAAGLEIVRQNITLLDPGRAYEHQLMEFNNENSFTAVKEVLFISRKRLEQDLEHEEN